MSLLTKFYLLQYKNWKLQLRKKAVTVFEILLPVMFCVLLMGLRTLVSVENYPNATYFPSYSIEKLPKSLVDIMSPRARTLGLAYTPKTTPVQMIMGNVKKKLVNLQGGPVMILLNGFDTEDELVEFLTTGEERREQYYLPAVVFDNPENYKTDLPLNISYTLRPRFNLNNRSGLSFPTWQSQALYATFLLGPREKDKPYGADPSYYAEGFLTLQRALHTSIIEYLNASAAPSLIDLNLTMERFPYPPYKYDFFLFVVQLQMPFLIMLSFIFISLYIPKEIVLEKEKKLKEAMKMMGMSNWLQWLAWFVKYLIFLAITTVIMAFILCPPKATPDNLKVIAYADFSVVWVFLLIYANSIICFSFMISVFFDKANAAAAAGGILFFCLYIPFTFTSGDYDMMSGMIKVISCLDFNVAMGMGMLIIGRFEGTGVGAQWNNINKPVTVDDNLTLSTVMLMLILDSCIFILVMWYKEAVFPGAYGIPLPPYFFVLPSYWCGTRQADSLYDKRGSKVDIGMEEKRLANFEANPVSIKAGIQIKGLTKSFKGKTGKKIAVNDLNLNIYEGQITALLGHNGAGKTTTMFMLTGFMPPTHGTALVNGYDITTDISSVRESLGLCPQHDILFDELTVEEHLYFFAKLKRCPNEKIEEQIDYYVKTLGIEQKRKEYAKTLSGGQKRKLSVAIALIGDSKIVILDEPTSGMDPSARRHMWDVLQSQRAGRTMILTTHFMDEADHLGDRIAIMADGVIQCSGSSLFLKKRFGAGYHMVMTKKPDCDVDKVSLLLRSHVPDSQLDSCIGAELSFTLPDNRVSSFPAMFSELERRKDDLGIMGYGVSVTTMEEVFMKVGEGVSNSSDVDAVSSIQGSKNPSENDISEIDIAAKVSHDVKKNTGITLFRQQFKAMLLKRLIYTMRNKILTISQIVLPLLFTALTIALNKTSTASTAAKMPFNLSMYGNSEEIYSNGLQGSISHDLSLLYSRQFKPPGQVTKLVSDPRAEILELGKVNIRKYNFEAIVAADFNVTNSPNGSDVTVLFNSQSYHAAPTALLYVDTAILNYFTNQSYSFSAANYPLPQTTQSEIEQKASVSFNSESFGYSANMMFGFSFLASSFVVFLITERSRKIKHSQTVSGVKWYNFWLSTFVWDYVNYLVPALLTVLLFGVAQVDNLADIKNGNMQPLYLIILMMLYGLALLPSMYTLQFLFTAPASGYVAVTFINLLTGITPQLVVTILNSINSTKSISQTLDKVFIVLLPPYNMGAGIANLYDNYQYIDLCYTKLPEAFNQTAGKESLDKICNNFKTFNGTFPCCKDNCGDFCFPYQENFLAWESLGIGRPLIFLVIQTVVFWLVVILIETQVVINLFYRLRPKILISPQESSEVFADEDVLKEMDRVLHHQEALKNEQTMITISGLSKYFGSNKAVDDIYLAIPKGECFGLLGVNGAGKTTTFRMLTGDETISGGTALLNSFDLRKEINLVQKSLGYCPQFDALIDQMTGEEMLYMYARLRGIPEAKIPSIVKDLTSALMLEKHIGKLTKDYSGGNKRKLSTAIALIGDPPIVFLDEPTTGMDPVARRMLWHALIKVRESGKTLILTSHSMEECEALCTRMAIMVNGKYRCLGSTQHLKNKFGAGYTLVARVSYPPDGSLPNLGVVEKFVQAKFPNSTLKDKHQNLLQYVINKDNLTWDVIFKELEENKALLSIEDYSLSQTTLEQVFINFARAQIPPEEDKPGCSKKMREACCFCCIPEYVVDVSSRKTEL